MKTERAKIPEENHEEARGGEPKPKPKAKSKAKDSWRTMQTKETRTMQR